MPAMERLELPILQRCRLSLLFRHLFVNGSCTFLFTHEILTETDQNLGENLSDFGPLEASAVAWAEI